MLTEYHGTGGQTVRGTNVGTDDPRRKEPIWGGTDTGHIHTGPGS